MSILAYSDRKAVRFLCFPCSLQILKVKDELMPQIIAAMDEDSKIARLMACRIVGVLIKACGRHFDEDQFTKTYTGRCKS